jgi:hypothetical protein
MDTLYVLPEEPDVGQAEPSLLDRARESAGSTLGRGFLAVMRRLDPTLPSRTEALRRQQAADAMRALLTSGSIRRLDGKTLRFHDDEFVQGTVLESRSTPDDARYADLVLVDDDHRSRFVAAFADAWSPRPTPSCATPGSRRSSSAEER